VAVGGGVCETTAAVIVAAGVAGGCAQPTKQANGQRRRGRVA
jgi:hypothetical protein